MERIFYTDCLVVANRSKVGSWLEAHVTVESADVRFRGQVGRGAGQVKTSGPDPKRTLLGRGVRIILDGSKTPITLHESYIEPQTPVPEESR